LSNFNAAAEQIDGGGNTESARVYSYPHEREFSALTNNRTLLRSFGKIHGETLCLYMSALGLFIAELNGEKEWT